MDGVGGDIVEEILARSDVEDLIRCKCVCKSWLSLISDPVFIKKHVIHSHNKDRKNNETRRIVMAWLPDGLSSFYNYSRELIQNYSCFMIGSDNGLVCLITPDAQHIFIDNPSIRYMVKQKLPQHIVPDIPFLCAGFGYDFVSDDYKLILGHAHAHAYSTSFHILSLKSNVWGKAIQLDYRLLTKVGVLCNGALHWFMMKNNNVVILSFDLSKQEFKEIPQPNHHSGYRWEIYHRLGIMNGCLSIYNTGLRVGDNIWIMNHYNVWEMLPHDCKPNCEVIHALCEPKNYKLHQPSLPCDSHNSFRQAILSFDTHEFICTTIFVQTLVSPLHIFNANIT